jgi:D-alanyl-D-alanine carboxypeptidase
VSQRAAPLSPVPLIGRCTLRVAGAATTTTARVATRRVTRWIKAEPPARTLRREWTRPPLAVYDWSLMREATLTRRGVLSLTTLSAAAAGLAASPRAAALPVPAVPVAPLERFIADYMRAMNSPGMTLGLANAHGTLSTAAYGYADLDARLPVKPGDLFEIGSITKSFVALLVLQLQDEGKLDVQHSILRYLPSLPVETDYGEIRIHHLLTHSSGMAGDGALWPTQPGKRYRQCFAPGSQFRYCNWGYNVLGHLVERVDGSPFPTALRRRLLAPLGMSDTAPAITSSARSRIVRSYVPLHDDRPYPRSGPLVQAGNLTFTGGAGCIASTALDMTRYMQMLLNRGIGPHGRVISEAGFKLFSTAHIKAAEFGPKASYGYGIAVDDLDGHARLRHTGGMTSFMSAMQLDMDAGVAAFASINAMQGYRPNPVAEYALQVLRRIAEGAPPPSPPPAGVTVEHPDEYTGSYITPGGRRLEVFADADGLVLVADGARVPLERRPTDADQFVADHPRFALFPFVFGREKRPPGVSKPEDSPPPVIEVGHGADWYAHSRYKGDRTMPAAPELAPFVGTYCADWDTGVTRIVLRKGQLWTDGDTPLHPIGDRLFRPGEDSSELVEFTHLVDGKAQLLVYGAQGLPRVQLPDDV